MTRRRRNGFRANGGRWIGRLSVALLLVATTAACRDDNPAGPLYSPPSDAITSPPATSEPPASAAGTTHLVMQGTFATEQGYRYMLEVDLTLLPPAKNVLNSDPGFAAIERQYDPASRWTLSNLLPDRNSRYGQPTGILDLGVWGFFRTNRPICQAIKPKPHFFIKFTSQLGNTCGLLLGLLLSEPPEGAVLPPNGSISGGFTTFSTSTPGAWQLQAVAETSVDKIIRDLDAGPDATALILDNALTVTGWRTPFGDDFDDDTACLIEANGGLNSTGLILFLVIGTQERGLTQYDRCGRS